MRLAVDLLRVELRCAACATIIVEDLPELIRPARHEWFGRRVYYSPETRLINWPALGERHCQQCGGDVTLWSRGYVSSRTSVRRWVADRWRRARGGLAGLLHLLARTPLDPVFTPEVYRVRGDDR